MTKELKENVVQLGNKIIESTSVDNSTGVVVEKDDTSVFDTNLPNGLTPKQVKDLSDYSKDYAAAGVYAIGQISRNAFAANQSLTKVSGDLKMGYKDSLHVAVSKTQVVVDGKDDEPVTKYGVQSVLTVRHGKDDGQMKIARNMFAEAAFMELTGK